MFESMEVLVSADQIFFPSFNNGRVKESLQNSCSLESAVPPGSVMMYMNLSSGNSQQPNIPIDIPSAGIHDSNVVSQQQFCESRSRGNEFSLLRDCRSNEMLLMGSYIPPSGIRFHSDQYQNPNMGFSCFGDESIQDSESYPYGIGNVISDSKHLKAAQELLDEVVNVKTALKQRHCIQDSMNDSKEVNWESKNQQDSSSLSAAEKQDLQNKMTKLSSMLNEVDRRYKQYHHQMQIVVSSFDVIAGCGAAKSYTALALQTISSHYRCLRDAINSQIKVTERRLGQTDSNGQGIAISRLRFVDQQLRQQRHVQQFGLMHQHIWRPQRGLPESSVSILRAWLFEHFLHPYPKDSEKIMLARQTGLTRSQVSNWFINARVRLWKPMVEEMYKEESADAAMDSNSSSDVAPKKTSLDQAEHMNQSAAASYQDCRITGPIVDDRHVFKNTIIQSNNEGVSLTLRLQHSENSSLPHMSLGSHHYSLLDLRGANGGGEVHDAGVGSSVGADDVDLSGFR